MAGLHLLKHMEGLSDEAVCARCVENPYYQYFCGEQYFRHKLPLDRWSMRRWRGRIGANKLELLRAETLRIAMVTKAMPPHSCERVMVDTTVHTKAVEAAIFQYINGFYNTRRRHSYPGGISPI